MLAISNVPLFTLVMLNDRTQWQFEATCMDVIHGGGTGPVGLVLAGPLFMVKIKVESNC